MTEGPLAVRVLGGTYGGQTSPLELRASATLQQRSVATEFPDRLLPGLCTAHDLTILHGRLQGGSSAALNLPAQQEGFIVLVKDSGPARIGEHPLERVQTGLISGEDAPITLTASTDEPVFFLLGVGKAHETGFAKMMGTRQPPIHRCP